MTGRWIVCEKTGKWAAALRWGAEPYGLRVYETRSLVDCRAELERFPASFVSLEATELNLETLVPWIDEVRESLAGVCISVLADQNLAWAEDHLREAGAVHVVFSPRRLDLVARIAARHLASAAIPQGSTLRQTIWSRLPWERD
jgi:hypothetical protein